MSQPFVSCICPTYNRREFLPILLHIFKSQEWPKDKLELVILDDSENSNEDIINEFKEKNKNLDIKYIYSNGRINLGKKRNMLNKYAKGEYIICFDDDDYYPPNRIKNAINKMKGSKKILSGSTILYVYYTDIEKILMYGPYGNMHCTNGTMAYHKRLLKDHNYEESAEKAEEKYFLKNYTTDMIQLNPLDVMICISHSSNTIDKKKLINSGKECKLKLKEIIKDKFLLNFYNKIGEKAKLKNKDIFEEIELREDYDKYDLEAIENKCYLTTLENMNNFLKEGGKTLPIPIKNRIDNIINKLNNKELKEYNNISILKFDDVINGKIKLSKQYVNIMIQKLKNNNIYEKFIEKFNKIKKLQDDNIIESNVITAINEYTEFNI